jgi:transcriptional regulator with XRE-family HTH domain
LPDNSQARNYRDNKFYHKKLFWEAICMNFSDAFDQTLTHFSIKGKDIAAESGLTEAAVSRFRNGDQDIKASSLEKLLAALPVEAKQYLFFKLLVGEMDQGGIATLLSAIAHHLREDNPQNSHIPHSQPALSLMRG